MAETQNPVNEIVLHPLVTPALPPGDYVLDAWHELREAGLGAPPTAAELAAGASAHVDLRVDGPRLRLDAAEILGRFPEAGATNVEPDRLAHVVLRRRTLPWERATTVAAPVLQRPLPWVMLLVLPEAEILPPGAAANAVGGRAPTMPAIPAMPAGPVDLGQEPDRTLLRAGWISTYRARVVEGETVEKVWTAASPAEAVPAAMADVKSEPCTRIELSAAHLRELVPDELALLAHVREVPAGAGDDDGYVSIVLGSRLFIPGEAHRAFLVSLEARDPFALRGRPPASRVAFVVLDSWRFVAGAAGSDFRSTVRALDVASFGVDATGGVPLPHRRRDGGEAIGAYHGPLVGRVAAPPGVPRCAQRLDELPAPRITLPAGDCTDVSHQAAFELGRLLALADRAFLGRLLEYRRAFQARAHAAMVDAESPLARSLGAGRKSAIADGTAAGLDARISPVRGLGALVADATRSIVPEARRAPAARADRSGVRHLAGVAAVPGLDARRVAAELGANAEGGLKSLTAAGVGLDGAGTLVGALAGAEAARAQAAAPLAEQKRAPVLAGATGLRPEGSRGYAGRALLDGAQMARLAATTRAGVPGFDPPPPPEPLVAWLDGLQRLERVPFPYLVPDPALLPLESARFFHLDVDWVRSLVDGALAAAAAGSLDAAASRALGLQIHAELDVLRTWDAPDGTPVTGVLLRSSLVRRFPATRVRAFGAAGKGGVRPELPIARRAALSGDCLLVLFLGVPDEVRFEQPAEGLQYGCEVTRVRAKTGLPEERFAIEWQNPDDPADAVELAVHLQPTGRRVLGLAWGLCVEIADWLRRHGTETLGSHHVAWALQQDPYVHYLRGPARGLAPPPVVAQVDPALELAASPADVGAPLVGPGVKK